MSDLFTKLLNRHLGTCEVVKPRGRSRFETETVGLPMPFHPLDIDGTEEAKPVHDSRVVPISVRQSPDLPINRSQRQPVEPLINVPIDQDQPFDETDDQNDNRQPVVRATSETLPSVNKYAPQIELPLPGPAIHRLEVTTAEPLPSGPMNPTDPTNIQASDQGPYLQVDLDNQLRAMFARLERHHSVNPAQQIEIRDSGSSGFAKEEKTDDDSIETAAWQQPVAESVKPIDWKDPTNRNHPTPQNLESDSKDNLREEAMLDPPAWFKAIQSQLNCQIAKSNNKVEPDPVVNVTIGSIEIKATKDRDQQRPRVRKKPSGVMSLEKYLHQSRLGGRK